MNRFFRRLIGLSALALASPVAAQTNTTSPAAPPPAWPVSTSPARFTIEPPNTQTPAILSQVQLFMPDPAWDGLPIRVFTDKGVAVGSDVLWAAPGEPVTLLFDSSSGSKSYSVYLASNWPPLHLTDTHAGVWLETRVGDGRLIGTVEDMLASWKKSPTVLGRAIVPGVFEGGNRFGPQGDLFLHLQGWFLADKPEHLDFAPLSVDPTFVLVDGKEAVKWTGPHDAWPNPRYGPPTGGVDLAAGIHVIDYYNAYMLRDNSLPVVACLAFRSGPDDSWKMLSPYQPLFRPVLSDHTAAYELQAAPGSTAEHVPSLAFGWGVTDDSTLSHQCATIGFVKEHFVCFTPPAGTLTWTFDDGTTAQGPVVDHVFPRPGLRSVQLTLKDGDRVLASVTRTVNVHFHWSPILHMEPVLDAGQEKEIMSRDPASFSGADLASTFALVGSYHKDDDLLKLAPQMAAKMKEATDDQMPYLEEAVLNFIHDRRDPYALQEQLLRALIDRTAGSTAPPLVAVASQSRLLLAQLLIKMTDQTAEVGKLIDAINVPALAGPEPRALDILRGDLLLANGDVDGARKKYQSLTGTPQGADARSSIRSTALIGQARAFIDRPDFDAAEETLRKVSWDAPIEKLAPDWDLARLRLYEAEKMPQAALIWARRLIPVITGAGRSELLYHLADLATAQNDPALAHQALDELLKKHPYSEEAAMAKERWPQTN